MIFSFFFLFNGTRKSNHTYIITVVNDYYVIPFKKYNLIRENEIFAVTDHVVHIV